MSKHVLFIHGAGDEGYELDKGLVSSLRASLGPADDIQCPHILTNESAADFEWPQQIGKRIAEAPDHVILAGHSLGASMLLKYISEHSVKKIIKGLFLISTPFWSGNEDWKKGLILQETFADQLPRDITTYFYHCRDDEEVPFAHLARYRQQIPWATFREIERGGHQLNNDLTIIANDIMTL